MDQQRVARTVAEMEAQEIDALICRLPENIVMLTGYWPLNGVSFLLMPRSGDPVMVIPDCEKQEAAADIDGVEIRTFRHGVLAAGDLYHDVAGELLSVRRSRGWKRVGYEGSFESVAPPWNAAEPAVPASATEAMFVDVFGRDALVDATGLIYSLRERKTQTELQRLRRVNDISTFGLSAFRELVAVGVTGVELVAAVESEIMIRGTGFRGARRVRAFAQVATGPEETSAGYRPMEITSTRKMQSGDVALLELGVVADGYWADRTRVRIAGTPSDEVGRMYETVLSAQQAAIDSVRAGVPSGDVDRAARDVVHAAGFTNEDFLHVTGHGLGFRYHEPVPLVFPGGETVLAEGMTHTVEPGLYRPGIGGVRVEDNIIVTADGAEVMGEFEKSLTG